MLRQLSFIRCHSIRCYRQPGVHEILLLHTNGCMNVVSMRPEVIPKLMQAADESIPWFV